MESVISYLKKIDPETVKIAMQAYPCLEPYGKSVGDYFSATAFVPESREDEVIDMLVDLRNKSGQYKSNEIVIREEYFKAEQYALVAVNAELFYLNMMQGDTATSNIHYSHMMYTLKRLMKFYGEL